MPEEKNYYHHIPEDRTISVVVDTDKVYDPNGRKLKMAFFDSEGASLSFGSGGSAGSPAAGLAHTFVGPITIDDPIGDGNVGVKLGTIDLGDPRFMIFIAAFAPTFDLSEGGNVAGYYLALVPEDVDPFDPDVANPNTFHPTASAYFNDSAPITGTLVLSYQDNMPIFVLAGDLTAPLAPIGVVDVWICHDFSGTPESLTLPDGLELRIS
jgi:hypothetical protein